MKLLTSRRKTVLGGLAVVLCLAVASTGWAGISKTEPLDNVYCNRCHDGGGTGTDGSTTLTCEECHSSDTSSTIYDLAGSVGGTIEVPVVNYTDSTLADDAPILAGGNFYWVENVNDTMGHNVFADNNDENLSVAPGASNGVACGTNSCHENLNRTPSAEGGKNGCRSCHMSPAHHTSSSGYVNAATDHNEYLGNAATKTSAGGFGACGSTMTGYCTGCHGNFHIENTAANGSGDWTRHPADHVIPATAGTEYELAFGSAGGGADGVWDPTVPVARPAGFNWGGETSSNDVNPGTDFVMCLSCHMAHGSPYPKMLRWDYTATEEGSGGCLSCHTEKIGAAGPCSDCHTMHNMENGSPIDPDNVLGNDRLLTADGCMACHTGTNESGGSTPYVYSTTEPTFGTNTLAGGNFYWVENVNDTMGHNVFADNDDDNLSVAPGASNGVACGANSCHENLNVAPSAEGGKNGCESCHMNPAHHTSSSGYVNEAPWFRWLSGHMGGAGLGVKGIEDPNWGYAGTTHNEYLGNAATKTSAGGFGACGSTTTGYCTGCHGNFHVENTAGDGSGDWIRHPADHVIPATAGTEYELAFGSAGVGADGVWDPTVPVARPAGFSWAGAASSNVVNPGTDFVMCLSCHVAHGSPYPKMLRWDPSDTSQGGRCVACHTLKVTGTGGQYHHAAVADCNVCHAQHGEGPPDFYPTGNLSLIDSVITTPNSEDQPVTFPSGGDSYYVSGAAGGYDGICEVCHTETSYYRNDGLDDEHPLYTGGEPIDPDWDCTSCHSHRYELRRAANQIHATHFAPLPGPGFSLDEDGCDECHGPNICTRFADGSPSFATTIVCGWCHTN
ncbi:MAG: hypothetical protein JRJ47_11235 [Deltaproteobacteria bacterium]|nr:hypothetical protein [Deltaproteobacteria bacterium]